MNSQMLAVARRPVRLWARQKSALSATGRDCFASKPKPMRCAVRVVALPDCCARHRSPPTATNDEYANIFALITRSSIRGSVFCSYVRVSDIQITKTGILPAHRRNRLGAIARHPLATEPTTLNASNAVHAAAWSKRLLTPHSAAIQRAVIQLAGAAALCCQGSARGRQYGSHSPPPLTAAAFRLFRRLGSGFGKFKAGALFSQSRVGRQTATQSKVGGSATAQSLESCCHAASRTAHISERLETVGTSPAFPFAFRVAACASSEGRPNPSSCVVLSRVAGQVTGLLSSRAGQAHRDCLPLLRPPRNRFLFRSLPARYSVAVGSLARHFFFRRTSATSVAKREPGVTSSFPEILNRSKIEAD